MRVRREYPDAARRLMADTVAISGSGMLTESGLAKAPITTGFRFAIDAGYEKLERFANRDPAPQARPGYVACLWDQKAYELVWSKETKSYRVTYAGVLEGKQAPRFTYNLQFGRFLTASFGVCGVNLLDALSESATALDGAEPISINGRECLRVRLRKPLGASTEHFAEVTANLDPSRGWVVLDGELQVGPVRQRQENSYIGGPDGRIRLRDVKVIEGYDPGNPTMPTIRWICDFKAIEHRPIPVADFSMSRYGIPSIVGPQSTGERLQTGVDGSRQGTLGTIIGLGALGLIAVGGLVAATAWRRRGRRRA